VVQDNNYIAAVPGFLPSFTTDPTLLGSHKCPNGLQASLGFMSASMGLQASLGFMSASMGLQASLGFMNASVGTGMLLGLQKHPQRPMCTSGSKEIHPGLQLVDNLLQELMNTSVKEHVTVPNISIAVVHCQ